jgi:uncharacterized protein YutE (UPF0331/DUF86 family)
MPTSETYSSELTVLDLDIDRIRKNKGDILAIRNQVGELVSQGEEKFLADKRNPLSLKYLLIQAVEAITDTCQHVLAKKAGVACIGYVDCIIKAGENGIITGSLSNKLRRLADLRNSLIHRYWIINDEELFTITVENVSDLDEFVSQIDTFVARRPA